MDLSFAVHVDDVSHHSQSWSTVGLSSKKERERSRSRKQAAAQRDVDNERSDSRQYATEVAVRSWAARAKLAFIR